MVDTFPILCYKSVLKWVLRIRNKVVFGVIPKNLLKFG